MKLTFTCFVIKRLLAIVFFSQHDCMYYAWSIVFCVFAARFFVKPCKYRHDLKF